MKTVSPGRGQSTGADDLPQVEAKVADEGCVLLATELQHLTLAPHLVLHHAEVVLVGGGQVLGNALPDLSGLDGSDVGQRNHLGVLLVLGVGRHQAGLALVHEDVLVMGVKPVLGELGEVEAVLELTPRLLQQRRFGSQREHRGEGRLGWSIGGLRLVLGLGLWLKGRDDLGDDLDWRGVGVGHEGLVDVHLLADGVVDVELGGVGVGVVVAGPAPAEHLQVLLVVHLPHTHRALLEGQPVARGRLAEGVGVLRLRLGVGHLQRAHGGVLGDTARAGVLVGQVEVDGPLLLGGGVGPVLLVEEGAVEVGTGEDAAVDEEGQVPLLALLLGGELHVDPHRLLPLELQPHLRPPDVHHLPQVRQQQLAVGAVGHAQVERLALQLHPSALVVHLVEVALLDSHLGREHPRLPPVAHEGDLRLPPLLHHLPLYPPQLLHRRAQLCQLPLQLVGLLAHLLGLQLVDVPHGGLLAVGGGRGPLGLVGGGRVVVEHGEDDAALGGAGGVGPGGLVDLEDVGVALALVLGDEGEEGVDGALLDRVVLVDALLEVEGRLLELAQPLLQAVAVHANKRWGVRNIRISHHSSTSSISQAIRSSSGLLPSSPRPRQGYSSPNRLSSSSSMPRGERGLPTSRLSLFPTPVPLYLSLNLARVLEVELRGAIFLLALCSESYVLWARLAYFSSTSPSSLLRSRVRVWLMLMLTLISLRGLSVVFMFWDDLQAARVLGHSSSLKEALEWLGRQLTYLLACRACLLPLASCALQSSTSATSVALRQLTFSHPSTLPSSIARKPETNCASPSRPSATAGALAKISSLIQTLICAPSTNIIVSVGLKYPQTLVRATMLLKTFSRAPKTFPSFPEFKRGKKR